MAGATKETSKENDIHYFRVPFDKETHDSTLMIVINSQLIIEIYSALPIRCHSLACASLSHSTGTMNIVDHNRVYYITFPFPIPANNSTTMLHCEKYQST